MEIVHDDGTPLAAYLQGEGYLESTLPDAQDVGAFQDSETDLATPTPSFAPALDVRAFSSLPKPSLKPIYTHASSPGPIQRIHNAWSTAVNSRIGRAENVRFIEHFRYIIVASQLLNEYLNQGALPPPSHAGRGLDGTSELLSRPSVSTSLYGAAVTAVIAFALVVLIHWARNSKTAFANKHRLGLVLVILIAAVILGYAYVRRQWLKHLRRQAVAEVSALTASWQTLEVSATSALSLVQEVDLVSKGYGLSTPLPPASRIENHAISRRCARLRRSLSKAYTAITAACIAAMNELSLLIEDGDLDKYFEVYDISPQEVKETSEPDVLTPDDDLESTKSLRFLSYRASLLRRVVLCLLLALEADGGKPDFHRWRLATDTMSSVSKVVGACAAELQQSLSEMETLPMPMTAAATTLHGAAGNGKLRSQVRKISMLSSGIRTLQAKMQILREETNKSIEQSNDLTELGPDLMAQYESIGEDLNALMQAWESGKASLRISLSRQENRMSLGSIARSPVSSLGGLTAVDEDGGPAAALKALTGGALSNRSSVGTNRSSMATSRSEDEVFEAVAAPLRQRSTHTREERIQLMQEERERQAILRAQRDSNTNMLKELESVISLRHRPNGTTRVTSM